MIEEGDSISDIQELEPPFLCEEGNLKNSGTETSIRRKDHFKGKGDLIKHSGC